MSASCLVTFDVPHVLMSRGYINYALVILRYLGDHMFHGQSNYTATQVLWFSAVSNPWVWNMYTLKHVGNSLGFPYTQVMGQICKQGSHRPWKKLEICVKWLIWSHISEFRKSWLWLLSCWISKILTDFCRELILKERLKSLNDLEKYAKRLKITGILVRLN